MTNLSNPNLNSKTNPTLLNQVLRYLGIRARSKSEIETYLHKRSTDPSQIEAVLQELTDLKLIDDTAFCRWFIESRLNQKPRGPHLIKWELKKYGLSSELISHQLSVIDPQTWYQAATRLLSKKAYTWSRLPHRLQTQKARQFLHSKGFSTDIVLRVIDEKLKPE